MQAVPRIRCLFFLALLHGTLATAQTSFRQTPNSYLAISGTSTLNEWTMTSKDARCLARFGLAAHGALQNITDLTFSVKSESFKSGHSAMDKNAYNTLNADAHKTINFEMMSATVDGQKINCLGKLTVAGTTREIAVESTYRVLPNGSLLFAGSKTLKMSEYAIEAPTFMFGTVTTGDEITVSFNIELVPAKK